MKETQIAKENVEKYLNKKNIHIHAFMIIICKEHLASCQRWLDFLVKVFGDDAFDMKEEFDRIIFKKQEDLRQAIKTYGDAGIK